PVGLEITSGTPRTIAIIAISSVTRYMLVSCVTSLGTVIAMFLNERRGWTVVHTFAAGSLSLSDATFGRKLPSFSQPGSTRVRPIPASRVANARHRAIGPTHRYDRS